MIVDRYPPMDLLALVPQLRLDFEPELRELDRLLEDDVLFQRVKADLARRSPQSLTRGRPGTPVEVILRMLVVKRLYRWSYEEVEYFVADSLVLRQFCRVYDRPVPDDTVLLRWADQIAPATLVALNERVVELARALKVTRGRKLRVDTTVVETNIHHPSDSGLLGDGVRVLSRLLRRAKTVLDAPTELGREAFRTRTRSVRRLARELHRIARRKGEAAREQLRAAYRRLVRVAHRTRAQAVAVAAALRRQTRAAARRLVQQFEQFLPRVDRAISQAVRRVLDGEQVPAKEKILSLFEPQTQVIVRQKPGHAAEFGRKLWLDEVEGGIISRYALLPEVGPDHPYLEASLLAHREQFGHPPWLLAGDRGTASPTNEATAKRLGVRRVAIPAAGKAPPERRDLERARWFRRGFRFRAGIEGRIHVLQRDFGLARCLDHGDTGMGRWVGWGVLAANLATIARTVAARPAR